jgi:endoglucanase
MSRELSHSLPWLLTSGNRIVRADISQPVLLRGVNRSGFEYSRPSEEGFLAAAQCTNAEIQAIVTGWSANIIRLPFNQDWVLNGANGHSAEEYMATLDQVISWAAALGAYTILDLQWLDVSTVYGSTKDANGVSEDNHVPPTPNPYSIDLWSILAGRYRDEPAVLFDLLNEPHDPLDDDFLPLYLVAPDGTIVQSDSDFVGPNEWVQWAMRLTNAIRSVRPNGLILVGGVDWAFDLHGIRVDAPNIVYSTHIYPNRADNTWNQAIGGSSEVPVFVGEWGGHDGDLNFGRNLAGVMRRQGLGWTAWSWVDDPRLVQPPRAPAYQPTAFGQLVRNELLS